MSDATNSRPEVSVIIPTYNRAQMLTQVLPSYLRFDSVREVLVIDDGSNDSTRAELELIQGLDRRIRLLRHPTNLGLVEARNTGLDNANSELILISEDDLELGYDSLELLIEHMHETDADIIAGRRVWMRHGESKKEALARANRNTAPPLNLRMLDVNSHANPTRDLELPLVNATMLVRRNVFQVVRYAECYRGNFWREESDFQLSACEQGYRVVFCPHATMFHHDRTRIGQGSNRVLSNIRVLYWIFRNNTIFLQRHYDFLRENYPEAIWLRSEVMTSIAYTIYRTAWLFRSETRRGIGHLQAILNHDGQA